MAAIDNTKKSARLLASRRYTHDTYTDAQEAFTSVLDINANEVYVDQSLIPSTGLPFSGSGQNGTTYSANGQSVLKYYYRAKMTKSDLNNEVWFLLSETSASSGIGAQLIDGNQLTNFVSPKYSVPALTNANTEDATPGYGVKVFVSSNSSSPSAGDQVSVNNYVFDYKTGVIQFATSALAPTAGQYVYITVNQYVGRVLRDNITNVSSSIAAISASIGGAGGGSLSDRITSLEATSASLLLSSSNHEGRIDSIEAYTSSLQAAITASGANVTINGDLTVKGTTTAVNSTTIQLGDNIIELNGTGAANGGLVVKDPTAPNTVSGSLLWDSTNDYWKAGALGAESKLLRAGGDNVVTSSAQILIDQTDGYTSFSSSIATALSASDATQTIISASVDSRLNQLSADSASQDNRLDQLETFSGSINNKFSDLSTYTSSLNSYTQSFSQSIATDFSASNASISSLSASVANVTGNFSSSVSSSFSASAASVTALSQSLDGRLDIIETTYATTGSNIFTGKQSISSSLEIGDSTTVFKIEGNSFSQTYLTSNGAIVLNPGYGGVEMVGSYRTFKADDITAEGTLIVKGSTTLGDNSADNTIISGSLRTHDIAYIGDSNTLYGNALIVSGGVDINNESMYPVSIKNNLVVSGSTYLGTDSSDLVEISGSLKTKEKVVIGSSTTQFATALEITGAVDINNESMYPVSIKNNLVISGSTILGTDSADSVQISASLNVKETATIGSSTTQFGTGLIVTGAVQIANESMYPVSIKSDLNVTGSISASNIVTTGYIQGAISASNGVVSGSSQITISETTGFTTFSQSVDSRLDTLEGTGTIQGVGTTNDVTFNKVSTAGDVIVGGDLVVQGNTVTLNTATLVVEDKLISLASGSTNAATANGAGIEVLGAGATLTYDSTPNAWTANIPISASAFTGSFNLPTGGSSKRIAFRNAVGNLDVVTAPTTSGDLLQWNGTDFVMSNVIDGGTY